MLIIVEGPDGAGKTSLVNALSYEAMQYFPESEGHSNADMNILHSGPLRDHPMIAYEYRIRMYHPEKLWLCDRWHIGEMIYGPLLRGRSQLTPAMRRHVDLLLAKLGAVKVFVDTPFDEVIRRCHTRGEDLIPEQHMRLIWDSYQELCTLKNGWLPTSRFKTSVILETAADLQTKAIKLQQFRTYVGPTNPKTLILGERRGPSRPGRPLYPSAFVPYEDTSGHFLLTALEAAGATSYGLANAWEEDVTALWTALGQPKVVVLGREAEAAMAVHGDVPITSVFQHPQYVRRFKIGSMQAYGQMIKDSIDG